MTAQAEAQCAWEMGAVIYRAARAGHLRRLTFPPTFKKIYNVAGQPFCGGCECIE